jgi:YHS domain-containing protein/uncharacterized membrane protein YraQ (UPF0718 family)
MPHLLALSTGGFFIDLGRSLKEGGFMLYDTFWALVLGFGLSGAVQAFVPRDAMQRRLGNHRPAAVARASLYGMVSSSCSYAASAMAKSLVARGADFVASMVFMFASTNLVVELGIVLAVLIGWQFVAAEFVGGTIMIVLLVIVGGAYFRGRALEEARRRVAGEGVDGTGDREDAADRRPVVERARSLAGWSDAATYTLADLTMLRREMVIGFGVAGFLAVLVPTGVWNAVFLSGHGDLTTLENVIVGPLIAILSFVCSIGNVPLAAALWRGGISFGGVVSFIFADLIAMPLLLIYRKLYGTPMAVRMLAVFWIVMSSAGAITEGIFRAAGIVPTTRPHAIVAEHVAWNPTSILDLVFFIVLGVLWFLARHRRQLGGGAGYAIDPVCGMQVEVTNAPASIVEDGRSIAFCSDHCRDRFAAHPERYPSTKGRPRTLPNPAHHDDEEPEVPSTTDPVCAMTVDPTTAAAIRSYEGVNYFFCAQGCAETFDHDPERYAGVGTPRP